MAFREHDGGGGEPPAATPARAAAPWGLVRTIIAAQFAPPFMFSAVAVALPALGAELHAGATSLGLVESAFLAGSVSFLLPIGWLADAGDKRTLFKVGLLTFGLSSLVLGLLSWLPAILALRFVQGIAGAAFAATGPAILADIVPAESRGRAYGGSLAATYSGLTLGPVLGGLLVDAWGWRSVFFAGAIPLLAAFVLMQFMLRGEWRRPERPPNPVSVLLVLGAVVSGVAGSATAGAGALGPALIALGFVLAALFVGVQPLLRRPLLNIGVLWRNAPLRGALAVQLLLYMTAFSSTFLLSLFLQVSLDRTAQVAGRVLATSTVLMAVAAPLAGRLADRFRPGVISTLGAAAVLGCAVAGANLGPGSTVGAVVVVLILQGLGFGLFSSPNMTTIMGSVPASDRSMTSALATKARHVGMVSGMLLATTLISVFIGDAPVREQPEALAALIPRAYTVLAGLNVLALLIALSGARRPT